MNNGLGSLYLRTYADKAPFGARWIGPAQFEHGKVTQVAMYQAEEGGDGQSVKVHCTAMPARFYTLEVLPENGKEGYTLTTGSGAGELAAKIAEAIASGMLGLEA